MWCVASRVLVSLTAPGAVKVAEGSHDLRLGALQVSLRRWSALHADAKLRCALAVELDGCMTCLPVTAASFKDAAR